MSTLLQLQLGGHSRDVAERLAAWDAAEFGRRLWDKDHTLWFDQQPEELVDRLGWLELPAEMAGKLPELRAFGGELAAEGFRHVVVLGMGGSSLAPEVYHATFGSAPGYPELLVLDSTHPGAVTEIAARVDADRTLFIVASKSGTTLETLSFFRFFWERVAAVSTTPGRHFVAVTDPGTSLADLAVSRGFRRVFTARPDVGGRYSALTYFGLVPAAAIGVDLDALLEAATEAAAAAGPVAPVETNPGLLLGAALGELALAGRDKVTFVTDHVTAALPVWIEQLIAESTGKADRGIVPVGGEPIGTAQDYGDDRFFVAIDTDGSAAGTLTHLAAAGHPTAHLRLERATDLAGAMFVLKVAVASAGAVIGIHPFNQPDVELAKELARAAMEGKLDTGDVVEIEARADDLGEQIGKWLGSAEAGDYVAIQAFLAPSDGARESLLRARLAIRSGKRVATTLDFGPRFLHSTGQLHKGGPNTGLFLQIIDHPTPELAVPETDYDFGTLVSAQALGDYQALKQRDRRVLLVCVADGGQAALDHVVDAIVTASRG